MEEVVSMTQQGVDPVLIQNYIRTSGVAQPLSAADVIYLHNAGVATPVIQTMQSPPQPAPAMVAHPTPHHPVHPAGVPFDERVQGRGIAAVPALEQVDGLVGLGHASVLPAPADRATSDRQPSAAAR